MAKKSKLKIIPLGGLNEIGKNMTVFEYGNDIFILDCGLAFPEDDMPGIDMVIPDFNYLIKNQDKIRGMIVTHGHEDHIGAIPYFLKNINVPIYGTRLTIGLIEVKLKEHGLLSVAKLNTLLPGDMVKLGEFKVEFIHTNHSIAGSVAVAIHTPIGCVVHTGDFKVDCTPIDGDMINLARFGELGKKGVLALMSDSTNVERPGYTMSESTVGETFDDIFSGCEKRIIVATFASNVHRVQQIINAAHKYGRKVAFSGRSMENVVEVASTLGYMTIPDKTIIPLDDIKKYRPSQLVLITTGSQGEPMSALSRMAFSDHRKVEIVRGDLVVISASPIPGNEKMVFNVINELFKNGAEVIYESLEKIHVSGHACQEELKLILSLTKPKYFIPVHGEFRHLKKHAQIGELMGVPSENVFISDNGRVLEIGTNGAKFNGTVPAGRVLIDGLGVGDVGNIVLRDRKHLAEDGIIIVVVTISGETGQILAGPDVLSRGFVYVRESEDMMEEARSVAKGALDKCLSKKVSDWASMKQGLKSALGEYVYAQTKRKPMILPVIMEV